MSGDSENTSGTGGSENTSATGGSENTSEGQAAAHDSRTEIDPTLRQTIHDEGFDNGLGKGTARAEKAFFKRHGVRNHEELDDRLNKADARASEASQKVKQERENATAATNDLAEALARVKTLEQEAEDSTGRLSVYEARAEQALLDRVRGAAASAEGKRVLPGRAMDLFVAAVRDRVRWNDEGTDIVVISQTPNGNDYADKTKTLSDLVDEAHEEMQFLFEPGTGGAGSDIAPGSPAASSSMTGSTGPTLRDRMDHMRNSRG